MKTVFFCVGNKVVLVEVGDEVCEFRVSEGFEVVCGGSRDDESGVVRVGVDSRGGDSLNNVVDIE